MADGVPVVLVTGAPGWVLAGIVLSAAAVEAFRSAIPNAQMTVVRVEAPVATLHDRLRLREPGTIRSFLLDLAPKLDESIAGLGVEDFVVANPDGQPIADLGRTVLERLGWPTP